MIRLLPTVAIIWTLCSLQVGCSSHIHRLQKPRQQFLSGDLLAAEESLVDQLEKKRSRDRDVLALDLAIVQLCQGNPRQAEGTLRQVRDRFDHLEQADVAESFAAMVTDDQRRAYAGEDYEKVLIRVFLALSNLMHDGGDATAYSLQINEKQEELFLAAHPELAPSAAPADSSIAPPPASTDVAVRPPHQPSPESNQLSPQSLAQPASQPPQPETPPPAHLAPLAVGPYLYGMLRESTHRHYDDAERAYGQVVQLAPDFAAGPIDWQRAAVGRHSAPGHGVLYVFGLVDRGPVKVERAAQATSDALLIADRILSATGPHQLPPTIAPVKIPAVEIPVPQVSHLLVQLGPQLAVTTETICDIGQLAQDYDQAARNGRIARAVVRRVVKKSAVVVAKDQLAANSAIADLAMTAAGVAWEATESADTRCWGLLPRAIQVCRCELPVGEYEFPVRPISFSGQVGPPVTMDVQIRDGQNTYALAYFPGPQPIGPILVGPR